MSAQIFYNNGSSSSEIITHLINASDGAGLHFDGTSGNIDIASPPDLGTKFSMELIIQADEWKTSGYQHFLCDFREATGDNDRVIFGTLNSPGITGELGVYSLAGGSGGWNAFTGNPKVLDDLKVHHLVLTIDGTAAILYDNGNQIGTAALAVAPIINNATQARIASDYVGGSHFFNGTIYRARLWNKTLEQADVTSVYESASLDFADQWGNSTVLNTGSVPAGLRWRIIEHNTVNFVTYGAANNSIGTEFVTTTAIPALNANDRLQQIGCVADYDLSYANPTQSVIVQNRSGSGDGTAAGGVTQITKIEAVNTNKLSVGGTTPLVGIGLAAGVAPASPLTVLGTSKAVSVTPADAIFDIIGTSTAHLLMGVAAATPYGAWINTDATSQPLILMGAGGNVGIGTGSPDNPLHVYKSASIGAHNYTNYPLKIESDDTSGDFWNNQGAGIQFENTASSGAFISAEIVGTTDGADGTKGTLEFRTSTSSTPTTRLTIDSAGNSTFSGAVSASGVISATASDYQIAINGPSAQPWYLRESGSSNLSVHLNATGDIAAFSSTGLAVTGAVTATTLSTFSAGIAFQSATTGTGTGTGYSLDKYETGTWTIGVTFGGGNTGMTLATTAGGYTRIGNLVTVTGYLSMTAKGSSTGDVVITGLPFPVSSTNNGYSAPSLRLIRISFADYVDGNTVKSGTSFGLTESTNAGAITSLTDANFQDDSALIFSLTYIV